MRKNLEISVRVKKIPRHATMKKPTATLPSLRKTREKTKPRERNLLALPTLDMYLPLTKFESIQ